jgi:cytochrome c2
LEPNFFAAAQQLLSQIPDRTELLEEKAAAARQALQSETEGGLLDGADLENVADLRQRLNAFETEIDEAARHGEPADAAARERLADVRKLRPDLKVYVEANERLRTLEEMTTLAEELVHQPQRNATRRKLHLLITQDIELAKAAASPAAAPGANEPDEVIAALAPQSHKLEPVLKDIEVPGNLRRAGPALRYVKSKDDEEFLIDWIKNPRHFRETTRMPKFFGLHEHLHPSGHAEAHESPSDSSENEEEKPPLQVAEDFEPIEILAMTTYLLDRSQKFDFLPRPEGVAQSSPEEQIARGRMLFETRGCLACHTHEAFPEATAYRHEGDMVQGPDLSGIGSKFDPERNPAGPDWLYSWIKEPTRYHPRTKMPDLFLDPYEDNAGNLIDPADDIVAFLLSQKHEEWSPALNDEFALDGDNLTSERARHALHDLALEFLRVGFSESAAEKYYQEGLPEALRAEQKGFEVELIAEQGLTDRQRLIYVGAKAISKYGCYGCHDVPGFEDAKPIGTGLADWGRKDTSRLAFEHITHYLHQQEHSQHGAAAHAEETNAGDAGPAEPIPDFYQEAIEASHREGFIFQKLRQPRSYDFEKAENKTYNEWLRMPQFPFNTEEREQVITFVLGLIADPPAEKFVYRPSDRARAIQKGRQVLAKYNCGGCHTLEMEKWRLTFPPGEFRAPPPPDTYSFVVPQFSPDEVAASKQTDRRGMLHATITGQPFLDNEGIPQAFDDAGDPVEPDEDYNPNSLEYLVQLFEPVSIEGNTYMVGPAPLSVKGARIDETYPAHGGYLARYLVPRVIKLEREVNPAAKASEAWGWVPPPLVGEGRKVQPDWLYNFLLNPYPIRPAVFLRMPKFNMSPDEAQALVNYFAAKDNANYPYQFVAPRQPGVLDAKDDRYAEQNQGGSRLDDAMKIVTNNAGCVKCHMVSDFVPQGSPRAKAPNLADVYRRLQPEYIKPYIAKPDSILPYTGMPVNINPQTGFATQGLYHGSPDEQLDALVDLLMNFDTYTSRRTSISDLVQAANPAPAAGEQPPAEAPPATGAETSSSGSQ